MKNFKRTFGVTGTDKQLAAFAEAAEGLGWVRERHKMEIGGESTMGVCATLFFTSVDHNCGYSGGTYWPCVSAAKSYELPSQWAEAIKAASEFEEVKFEVGKKYVNSEKTNIVLCTAINGQAERHFAGVVIQCERKPYRIGHTSDTFVKELFTPYNEPVTL